MRGIVPLVFAGGRFASHLAGHPVDRLHELGQPRSLQHDLVVAAVEDAGKQRLLERQHRQHAFLDRSAGDEVDHLHAARLAEAMDAADPLLENRRIPGQIHIDDDRRRMLQVEADATGVGAEEDAAVGIAVEAIDEGAALVGGDAAVEQHMLPATWPQAADDQFVGAQPLAEDDDLGL
ncbi:MAG: hypothetical protein AW12_02930 [Candidatus Accumulibacter sp. BA-94]|nr:MAG: hypothetical protein AW12_02930 [Candidatus Accumulibacter sp. BA-94]